MTYTDQLIAIGTAADAELAQAVLDLAQTRIERDALAVQNVDLRQAVSDLEQRIAELEAGTEPEPEWVTMTDARLESGHTYERVIFKGGSASKGVLHIAHNLRDVVVRDCIVESGPQNGITINATDSVKVENVTFENVIVAAQPCMGIEVTDRTYTGRTTPNYFGITLDHVTVEPAGAEGITFDSNPHADHGVVIRDVVVKGAGNRPDLYPWGQGFELNGVRGVTVERLTIHRTRGAAFNFSGPGTGVPCGWTFTDVVADMRIRDAAQTQDMSNLAQVLYAKNMTGSVWRDCVVAAGGTGSWCGYLTACTGNDFGGVTWIDERVTKPKVGLYNGSTGNVGLPS